MSKKEVATAASDLRPIKVITLAIRVIDDADMQIDINSIEL